MPKSIWFSPKRALREGARVYLAGGLLGVLVAACEKPTPSHPVHVGVYSEFLEPNAIEAVLPALAQRHIHLNLALPEARIGHAQVAALLRAAHQQKVRTRLWLLLSREQGYWPNESNAAAFRSAVLRLLAWIRSDDLPVDAIVFDMEPALAYAEALLADKDQLKRTLWRLQAHRNPDAFETAKALFIEAVADVHAQGLKAVVVTVPQVLDDLQDGDEHLQDALDVPVTGVPFDEFSFMVYQSVFAETLGTPLGPGLIRSYAQDAVRYFGDKASLALGLVGRAGIVEPQGPTYTDPKALQEDIAAALGEGIGRLELYSLDGMLGLGSPAAWLNTSRTTGRRAGPSLRTAVMRTVIQGADRGLDWIGPEAHRNRPHP